MKMIYTICKFLLLLQDFLSYLVLILSGLHAYSDEVFIESPPNKAKTSSSKPAPATSEASAPATSPTAQFSTASSLSKGKEISSTAAITASPPPGRPVSFSVLIICLLLIAPESVNFLMRVPLMLIAISFLLFLGFPNGHFHFGGFCLSIHFARS
jgi:hypothetical protein